MKKFTRWSLASLLGVLLLFVIVTPVLAIAEPDSISINAVYAYRNCREDNDQLYIVEYYIDYTSNPDENVTEAFLCRLMDGTTELGSSAPYAYYDEGYDRGVVAIYFSAADAPTWEGSYTMRLEGNPILSWTPSIPLVTVSTFNLWHDYSIATTQTALSARILYLADILEVAWSVDLIESTATGSVLTAYGESYFTNVIPYLSDIAPYVFEGQTIEPDWPDDEYDPDYADELEASIIGTPLDLTPTADIFGVTRGSLTALLYYGAVVFAGILVCRGLNTYKPLMIIMLPAVIVGHFVGVPLQVTILIGFISLLLIGYALFYKPSPA